MQLRSSLVLILSVTVPLGAFGCSHKSRRAPNVAPNATVVVQPLLEDGQSPAGSGVAVRAIGVTTPGAGAWEQTGADGTVTLSLPAGSYVIECLDPWLQAGTSDLQVEAGALRTLPVVLLDEGCVLAPELQIEGLVGGVLPDDLLQLRIGFTLDGASLPVDDQGRLEVRAVAGGPVRDVSSLFAVLRTFAGAIELAAFTTDASGHRIEASREFFLGQHRIDGTVQALVSTPAVPVQGLQVTARVMGSSLVLTAVTDATGAFVLPAVPAGQLEFEVQSTYQEAVWTGFGVLSVAGDVQIAITLLGVPEILAGQPSLVVVADQGSSPTTDVWSAARRWAGLATSPGGPGSSVGLDDATANATSGAVGVRVAGSATLSVPQGVASVVLRYAVVTAEYPMWVLAQSIYNDVWELRVLAANGSHLFGITRRVNEQLSLPPVWQGDGSTGTIVQELDLGSLTATGPVQLVVAVAATNIGDGLYPTTVEATLTAAVEFRVRSVAMIGPDVVSIPPAGSSNANERQVTVAYMRPNDVQLTEYRVEITAEDTGTVLQDLGRRPAPAELPQDQGFRIDVPVTFPVGLPSTIPGVPPPADKVRYRITLFGMHDATEIHDTKSSPKIRALWRMPEGLSRYSCRDQGGDDWCSRQSYGVLVAAGSFFPAINDISGEHGMNIGHKSHRDGHDIDIYHFTQLDGGSGPCSPLGDPNIKALREAVIVAFGAGPAAEEAKAIVVTWFAEERSGLDTLTDVPEVTRVLVAHGIAKGPAKKGYYRDLLFSGVTVSADGATLDLGLGAWQNEKVRSDAGLEHEHHSHVDIAPAAIIP